MPETGNRKRYKCPFCDQDYQHRQSLFKHKEKMHSQEILNKGNSVPSKIRCNEEGCFETFKATKELRTHLAAVHAYTFNVETKTFQNMNEFTTWKSEHEKKELVTFVRHCGKNKKPSSYEQTYYYCHRSGLNESISSGKRRKRISGKMGFFCTAYMTATVNRDHPEVTVEFCNTHYGHTKELRFLRLTEEERHMVGEMIVGKLKPDAILEKIKKTNQGEPQRIHLLSKMDISNIMRSFHPNSAPKDTNDATSVRNLRTLIEELKSRYPQGQELEMDQIQETFSQDVPVEDVETVVSDVSTNIPQDSVKHLQEEVESLISIISLQIRSCTSADTLREVKRMVASASNFLNVHACADAVTRSRNNV